MRFLFASLVFFLLSNSVFVNSLIAQVTWQKVYGDTSVIDQPIMGKQTFDGGYFISGWTDENAADSGEFFLMKTDYSGNILWRKTFGEITYDRCWYAEQDKDSGFILTGASTDYTANPKILVIKTDSVGSVIWAKNYFAPGYNLNSSSCIHRTFDDGYLILGQSFISQWNTNLIKTDSIGNIVWEKQYSGDGNYFIQTNDSGYIIVGRTWYTNDIFLLKVDVNGMAQWSRRIGGTDSESGSSVLQIQGGYLVAGGTRSFPNGSEGRGYLIKTDNSGIPIWSKTYGRSGVYLTINSLCQSADSNFIFHVAAYFPATNGGESSIIKVDLNGDTLWTNSFSLGNLGYGSPNNISLCLDSGFVILAGALFGGFAPHLIKTDSLGYSNCFNTQFQYDVVTQLNSFAPSTAPSTNIFPTVTTPTLNINSSNGIDWDPCLNASISDHLHDQFENIIYPNPSTQQFKVEWKRKDGIRLEIYSLTGEQIYSEEINGTTSQEINCDKFIPGLYYLSIVFENGEKVVSKISIMK